MQSFVIASLFLTVYCINNSETSSLQGIEKRILGGQRAKTNQFPYQVRLEISKPGNNGQFYTKICGGSLLSAGAVVTAAHCLTNANSAIVQLGTTNLMVKEPTRISVPVQKNNFIIHELYNPEIFENDIALIILPEPVVFNAGVQPVRLPRRNTTQLANRMGIISGFGKMSDRLPISNELRFANRMILPEQECLNAWRNQFRRSQICIDGSGRVSACPGDSGGPLVIIQSDGLPTLVGLTSYGNPSCEKGLPSVYTRITSFLEWIDQKTGIPIAKD